MRFYFYAISGIISSLIGWSLSQIFLLDLSQFIPHKILAVNPDIILLPIVAACLAVAMVMTEIFLSNPTRYKSNRRVLPPYLYTALLTGTVAGLVASALTWVLYRTGIPAWSVRVIAWSVIGLFTGLGEGTSWQLRSIEARTRKATQRIWKVLLFGFLAGFLAAVLVEILRSVLELQGYEDPLGFVILGLILGLFLSKATSPTYQVALRAGEGFEAVDPKYVDKERILPRLLNHNLRFVTQDDDNVIEEGLSIQLPAKTTDSIKIGSSEEADIFIPDIPNLAAVLTIAKRKVMLTCLTSQSVQIQSKLINVVGRAIPLRHNQILTFYHASNDEKYYRFVFYDRFLDPES
ncbi:hypothetical protein NUACC21_64090 [Scytonema sp. NUACC21]